MNYKVLDFNDVQILETPVRADAVAGARAHCMDDAPDHHTVFVHAYEDVPEPEEGEEPAEPVENLEMGGEIRSTWKNGVWYNTRWTGGPI